MYKFRNIDFIQLTEMLYTLCIIPSTVLKIFLKICDLTFEHFQN